MFPMRGAYVLLYASATLVVNGPRTPHVLAKWACTRVGKVGLCNMAGLAVSQMEVLRASRAAGSLCDIAEGRGCITISPECLDQCLA